MLNKPARWLINTLRPNNFQRHQLNNSPIQNLTNTSTYKLISSSTYKLINHKIHMHINLETQNTKKTKP